MSLRYLMWTVGHVLFLCTHGPHFANPPQIPFTHISNVPSIYTHLAFILSLETTSSSPSTSTLQLTTSSPTYPIEFSFKVRNMSTSSGVFSSLRSSKVRPWGRCSKYIRQQRTRLYIIWRCTVLLLCWHE